MTGNDEGAAAAQAPRAPTPLLHRCYAFLVSPRLAIALLVTVLACCIAGVTVVRDERAWVLIFSTLWFNALLVVLAISSGAAFFTRIWKRKLTLVSGGMILFHLSFVALLGGVVFNSLFHFRGVLRLTEGETLSNGQLESYDLVEHGRFFGFERLRGETTLLRMHPRFVVDGEEKRAAYEVAIGEGDALRTGTIFVNGDLEHDGVRYLRSKEGYSVLVVMTDPAGREVYGAHVPLQSLKQPEGGYVYATGSSTGVEGMLFPAPPEMPLAELIVSYRPDPSTERAGEVTFDVVTLEPSGAPAPQRRGEVPVGAAYDAGPFRLTPVEIRYWVGMDVRYDPGVPIVLASLCSGLLGMVITLIGRVRQGTERRRAFEARAAA